MNRNSSLCMDALDFPNDHSQFPSYYESGSSKEKLNYPTSVPVHSEILQPPWENFFLQQRGSERLIENARKRLAEASPVTKRNAITTPSTDPGFINSAINGKRPRMQREKASTVRRSQKMTDKITALQKLVSRYGKTDTASVLLEASISIKSLQHQIQDLFHMLSGDSQFDMRGGKRVDLRSSGLCLVPLSLSKKFTDTKCPPFYRFGTHERCKFFTLNE